MWIIFHVLRVNGARLVSPCDPDYKNTPVTRGPFRKYRWSILEPKTTV